ncbi:uncharacterized protein DUF4112 [Yoonia maricola]|uniref:Uncharacterized protein DUF4112 n=1 Tax=Yoonia maricola TaxID=420999 RepID=A0A2M8W0L5_9RHOB|nr:DUF4112 domain-containing protein [Yoonia maricola]PJI84464.1 uncharacterized protein DUF4112 [Yoonia maricola]
MSTELAKFERWSEALDSKFTVFGFPVGWDSILGLVPGVGDAVTIVPAAVMINAGYRHGIRKRALGRMVWNTGLDLAVGSIPLVGDLFDFAFKSHKRNVAVLREEFARLDIGEPGSQAA